MDQVSDGFRNKIPFIALEGLVDIIFRADHSSSWGARGEFSSAFEASIAGK